MLQAGKKITKDNILYLLTLWLCVWAISPPLSYDVGYRVISLCSFCLFFMMTYKQIIVKNKTILILLLVCFSYTIMVSFTFDGYTLMYKKTIQLMLFFVFLYIFLYYKEVGFNKIYSLVFIVLILYGIWNCITISALNHDSSISRYLTQSLEDTEQYTNAGIGGYGLVYSILPLVAIVSYLIFQKIFTTKVMFLSLFFTISGICLIFKAGYSIALILLFISLFLVFVLRKKSISHIVFFIAILGLFGLVWKNNSESIFDVLEGWSKGTFFEVKIRDIHQSLNSNIALGTVEGRLERYMRSINLFFDNPVFGCLEFMKVGKDSTILDKFAQYGLLIGSLFIILILYVPYTYCRLNNRHFGVSFSVFVTVSIFASLNNIPLSLGASLFIIYPVLYSMLINKDIIKYHRK